MTSRISTKDKHSLKAPMLARLAIPGYAAHEEPGISAFGVADSNCAGATRPKQDCPYAFFFTTFMGYSRKGKRFRS